MTPFLTVGTDKLVKELFLSINDSNDPNKIKPNGGLWATTYLFPNYNEWVDYILQHLHILFYKQCNHSVFVQPCCLLELNSDAHIYQLNNKNSLDALISKFPHPYSLFSYEELSKEYDGIYIDLNKLYSDTTMDKDTLEKFATFGVNSLILFNLEAISTYQSGTVNIEPFDYECPYASEFVTYQIDITPKQKKVITLQSEYEELMNEIFSITFNQLSQRGIEYNQASRSLINQIINESLQKYRLDHQTSQHITKSLERLLTRV